MAGNERFITTYEIQHPSMDIQLDNFDYMLYLQTTMPAGEEDDILQSFRA